MYYYFDLKIELYDKQNKPLINQDITGADLQKINAIINKFYSAYSGAILAHYEEQYLDAVRLDELRDYTCQDFTNWVLKTNDLAYDVHQNLEEQKEARGKRVPFLAQKNRATTKVFRPVRSILT